jgi:hypothetical protein
MTGQPTDLDQLLARLERRIANAKVLDAARLAQHGAKAFVGITLAEAEQIQGHLAGLAQKRAS